MDGPIDVLSRDVLSRVTVKPEQCGGRPCIRNMRIRVSDVLDLVASGLDAAEIVRQIPALEPDDVKACLQYAARAANHPVLTYP